MKSLGFYFLANRFCFDHTEAVKIFVVIFLVSQFISSVSLATMAPRMYSVLAQVSGAIAEDTDVNSGAAYKSKFSIELLYLVRGGPTFGFRYFLESRNEISTQSGQAYGPVAGYFSERGFFILATYDILAKLGLWTNGEGFQFDVGYIEHLGSQIHLGAKISTRKIRYKSDITNSLAVEKNVQDTFPSVVLTYLF